MSDPCRRLPFLYCLAAVQKWRNVFGMTALANDGCDIAGLLLDRRLVMARGRHVTSFISGMVALLLSAQMLFPESAVLSTVSLHTLKRFELLVLARLPALRHCRLLFSYSRDGVSAAAFHSLCDRQGPTLTLIKDTDGNVFGGYAAVEWGSAGNGALLEDPASFLFTVLNPHANPPALFVSKATGVSIYCASWCGPHFGRDLWLTGALNGQCGSDIRRCYYNTSQHSGTTLLTGAEYFTPAEVEVWAVQGT